MTTPEGLPFALIGFTRLVYPSFTQEQKDKFGLFARRHRVSSVAMPNCVKTPLARIARLNSRSSG